MDKAIVSVINYTIRQMGKVNSDEQLRHWTLNSRN